jgi:hypothetical protein
MRDFHSHFKRQLIHSIRRSEICALSWVFGYFGEAHLLKEDIFGISWLFS